MLPGVHGSPTGKPFHHGLEDIDSFVVPAARQQDSIAGAWLWPDITHAIIAAIGWLS